MARRNLTTPAGSSLIPASVFEMLPYWKKLSRDEQQVVESESQQLARAQFAQGASKMEMGKHLVALRDRLERYGVFVAHLKHFRLSQRTAYRYIGAFENARKRFPEGALSVALARGFDMLGETPEKPFGKYTPVLKRLPPPKTNNPKELNEWADNVEVKYKEYRAQVHAGAVEEEDGPSRSPDTLLKESFRFARVRMTRLTPGRQRTKFVHDLSGMLLAELGVSGHQTIDAQVAPEEFKQGRGRPKAAAIAN
jgi:hypothetical protein